jgi:hypothetical protein
MPPSYTQATDFWHERDFGQKITATFEFIGAHWRPLGRVLLYLVVPAALLQSIIVVLLQSQLLQSWHDSYARVSGYGYLSSTFTSPLYYLSAVTGLTLQAVLLLSVYGYLLECLYPTYPGAPITVADVWVIVKQRFLGTFFSLLALALVVMFASVFFVIPGLYLAVALSLFFIIQLIENSDFSTTFSRCLNLIKGNWWSTCGLIFIMLFLLGIVRTGMSVVLGLVGLGAMGTGLLSGLSSTSEGLPILGLLIGAISTLVSLLVYPPILLSIAFQYFNLVERREGVGLRQLVDQLGQAPQAAPGSSTYRPDEEGEY